MFVLERVSQWLMNMFDGHGQGKERTERTIRMHRTFTTLTQCQNLSQGGGQRTTYAPTKFTHSRHLSFMVSSTLLRVLSVCLSVSICLSGCLSACRCSSGLLLGGGGGRVSGGRRGLLVVRRG
mmetsp:Transcript_7390/g.18060  ORF Transcript_7390/g.18060 Transcript_7390/m.18060 type:complete len:123 (+) Transcript_7390:580-948(+)